jgi:hypothetical protein
LQRRTMERRLTGRRGIHVWKLKSLIVRMYRWKCTQSRANKESIRKWAPRNRTTRHLRVQSVKDHLEVIVRFIGKR